LLRKTNLYHERAAEHSHFCFVFAKKKKKKARFCSDLLWCKPRVTLLGLILPGSCWPVLDHSVALRLTQGMTKLGEIRGFCHVISIKILLTQINSISSRVIDFAKFCQNLYFNNLV